MPLTITPSGTVLTCGEPQTTAACDDLLADIDQRIAVLLDVRAIVRERREALRHADRREQRRIG